MKKIYSSILVLCLFSVSAFAQPSNDNACSATALTVDGASVIFNNTDATVQTDEPSPAPGGNCFFSWCDGAAAQNSSWFTFTAPSNGAVVVTTCLAGNTVDTQLALYEVGNCSDFGSYTLVGANDDMPGDCSDGAQYSSTLSIDGLTSGSTYYLQLDGFDSGAGEIEIAVSTGIPTSVVTIIHNSADDALAVVDIWANGELVGDDVNALDLLGNLQLEADVEITFSITAFDAVDESSAYYSSTLNLNSAKNYVLMFSGIYSDSGYDPLVPVTHSLFDLSDADPSAGMWNLVTGHGVTDAPTVDLELVSDGSTFVNNISFGELVLSSEVETGNYTVEVTDENGIGLGLTFCLPLSLVGNGGTSILLAHGFLNPFVNSNGDPITLYIVNPFSGQFEELLVGDCPIPTNDDICSAEELIVNGPSESFNNTFATAQTNEPTPPNLPLDDPEADCLNQWCDGSDVANTLWFYFVAPASGSVAVSTCLPVTMDTQTAVWSVGDCNDFGTLTLMGQNDDADGGCGAGDLYASAYIQGGLTPGGTYYIQLDGWGGTTGDFEIEVFDMVSVNESDLNQMTVYPNPVINEMMVTLPAQENAKYSIHDMTGKMVESGLINSGKAIDCSKLSSGVYHIHAVQNGLIYTTRFVKE